MLEVWAIIPDYGNKYRVSDTGRVYSNYGKGRFLKDRVTADGYLHVALSIDGERHEHKVHRLVADAFIPNLEDLPDVNHLDEDKHNNSVDNLEWCHSEYNLQYSNARHYIFVKGGQYIYIYNLSDYCRENDVSYHGLYDLFRGRSQQYAGYTMPVGG